MNYKKAMLGIAFLCYETMKEKIKNYAKELNIEFTGIAPVERYKELEERIKTRKVKYGLSEFEEKNIEKRVDPTVSFSWAKSIIVCLFPYYTGEDNNANISRYARVPDYHSVAKEKLEKICEFIKEQKQAQCECFSDVGVLHDRYLAYLAGLGFWGMNTCLINEKYGTYFFIGYIVTDLELLSDKPMDNHQCIKCGKCILNCPGGAIDGDFDIDVNKCVSYITQLKDLTKEQKEILKNQDMVYGCDRCQEVCPYNENVPQTPIAEFYEKRHTKLEKEELLSMSNREFKNKYGDFPFSWRGKGTILKNFDN